MARVKVPAPVAAAGLDWFSLSLVGATKSDPGGLEHADTDLAAGRLKLATGVHGRGDAGKDGLVYAWRAVESPTWGNYRGCFVKGTGDFSGMAGTSTTIASLRLGPVSTLLQSTMAGPMAGYQQQSNGIANPVAALFGAAWTANTGVDLGEPSSLLWWIPVRSGGPSGCSVTAYGASAAPPMASDLVLTTSHLDLALELGTSSSGASVSPEITDFALEMAWVPA